MIRLLLHPLMLCVFAVLICWIIWPVATMDVLALSTAGLFVFVWASAAEDPDGVTARRLRRVRRGGRW